MPLTKEGLESPMSSRRRSVSGHRLDDLSTSHYEYSGVEETKRNGQAQALLERGGSVRVARWQVGVIVMYGAACVSVLTVIGLMFSRYETAEFRSSYEKSTTSIIDAARSYSRNVEETYEALADNIASHARLTNQSWPFVTLKDFEIMAGHARVTSRTEALFLVPLVFRQTRSEWEDFVENNTHWLDDGYSYEETTREWLLSQDYYHQIQGREPFEDPSWDGYDEDTLANRKTMVSRDILTVADKENVTCLEKPPCLMQKETSRSIYGPIWQTSPPPKYPLSVNYNLFSDPSFSHIVSTLLSSRQRSMMTGFFDVRPLYFGLISNEYHNGYHNQQDSADYEPHSLAISSIYTDVSKNSHIVAILASVIPWNLYLSDLLPEGDDGIHCVLHSTCGKSATFLINGPNAKFLGFEDMHDRAYDDTRRRLDMNVHGSAAETKASCAYSLNLYATDKFMSQSRFSQQRVLLFGTLPALFAATAIVFLVYVRFVHQRQVSILKQALRSNALVSSVFPDQVCKQLLDGDEAETLDPNRNYRSNTHRQVAEFHPAASIFMCNIAGFSAWSSMRQPSDVFCLLETVFGAFDKLAKRRNVYKIETTGDKYVAVVGVPKADKMHAVTCCRFAAQCRMEFASLTKKLEATFGPDTGDLSIRIAVHSGPVTAGVMRGDRARYQLFGDAVSVTARMEATCNPGMIHLSKETAQALGEAGKQHWVTQRDDKVFVNGRGESQSFWLNVQSRKQKHKQEPEQKVQESSFLLEADHNVQGTPSKIDRLLDWHVENLSSLLRAVGARRQGSAISPDNTNFNAAEVTPKSSIVLEEVCEIIALPTFDPSASHLESIPESIDLGPEVMSELRQFVRTTASLYRNNAFHNFEHATHVVMAMTKFLSRIVAPSALFDGEESCESFTGAGKQLHDHTYGITSDPLTQFACVFSALIHDVDHRGVGNPQLGAEDPELNRRYKGKAIAEQNSVDISWDELMKNKYGNLRKAIFVTESEYCRFRQLVVNSVLATELLDKDLKSLRNDRWQRAFATDSVAEAEEDEEAARNRKATIVIEHLIQASDVSHTMQHWQVYKKWNYRLFKEMHEAFEDGRSNFNPANGWADGEIGFFDYYIIPLARKLQECGVFGVSSFECLDYALRNRDEWASKGREVVEEYMEQIRIDADSSSIGAHPGDQYFDEDEASILGQSMERSVFLVSDEHDSILNSADGKSFCREESPKQTSIGDDSDVSTADSDSPSPAIDSTDMATGEEGRTADSESPSPATDSTDMATCEEGRTADSESPSPATDSTDMATCEEGRTADNESPSTATDSTDMATCEERRTADSESPSTATDSTDMATCEQHNSSPPHQQEQRTNVDEIESSYLQAIAEGPTKSTKA